MLIQNHLISCFLGLMFCVFFACPIYAHEENEPSVLVLSSYHQGEDWSDREIEGLSSSLKSVYPNIILAIEYLDAKRFPGEEQFVRFKTYLESKHYKKKIDTLVILDNPALQFIKKYRADLFPGAAIVFGGINGFLPEMLEGMTDITGVTEDQDMAGTLDLILKLHPRTKKVLAIHDYTSSGMAVRRDLEEALPAFSGKVAVEFTPTMAMAELQEKLRSLPPETAVMILSFVTDGAGVTFTRREGTELICRASNAPVYAMHQTRMGFGIVGGLLISGKEHGMQAGEIVLRIARGESAGNIPVQKSRSTLAFDYRVMQRFGIAESSLPPGSAIIEKPVSLLRKLLPFIIGALALLILEAALIVVLIRRSKELKAALLRTEESEARLRNMSDAAGAYLWEVGPDMVYTYVTGQSALVKGYEPELLIGHSPMEFMPAEDVQPVGEIVSRAITEKSSFRLQHRDITPTGEVWWEEVYGTVFCDESGSVIGLRGTGMNINARRQAEESILEINERFSAAFNNAPVMFTISNLADGTYLDVNQLFLNISGFSREEVIGKTSIELGWIKGPDRDQLKERMQQEGRIQDCELTLHKKSGESVFCRYWGEIITISGQKRLLSIALDVTEQRRIEQQFLQAQKLECVGQLAGGIAHDFNNMLGIIIGRSEMALMRENLPDSARNDLQEILHAGERSAEITKQLLVFSRQQIVQPKVLDLNDVISGMIKMLRRLIGEDTDLSWNAGYGLWKVLIDQSQVDQILANLCVNARDAIAGTGRIVIETENVTLADEYADVTAGDYVMVAVSDTGAGMDREVMEHIFEPFYTTKELGHGTGLGLATVFGIVKQNNGHIKVYSEPGSGTVFRLYLPAVKHEGAALAAEQPKAVGGSETVLLVEDEPSIKEMTSEMLATLGYRVLSAGTPEEAQRLAVSHQGTIGLLLTDVIMPGMNGRDLAQLLLAENPGMKCLFISGYTANVISDRGKIEDHEQFLQKPFNLQLLAHKVREVLDGDA